MILLFPNFFFLWLAPAPFLHTFIFFLFAGGKIGWPSGLSYRFLPGAFAGFHFA